jgi:uncharacterized protein (TIGR02996 family)
VTDADALLRAIVRHPEDDTPRLVYADWLQENGREEEGEFIRVQCQLSATDPEDPDYPALLEREEELRLWLGTHVPGPRPTFPAGLSVEGGTMWWQWTHRGFPRFLEFDGYERPGAKAMRALAAAVAKAFDVLPTRWLVVRFITVNQLGALLRQPVLSHLSQLTVQLAVDDAESEEAARLLAKCRHLRNLRGLSLAFTATDAGCEALASAPWGELEWFSPGCHEVTPAGLESLAAARWFRNLRTLMLTDGLPGDAFESLCRLPRFPHLHTLDLSNDQFPEAAWRAFAAARSFPALARLQLEGNDLSGGRLAVLARAGGFTPRVLDLGACGVGPGSAAALADAPWAGSLRVLNLSVNALSPAEVRAIAGCKKFTELRHLDLADNSLGASGLAALAANPALRELRALNLSGRPHDNRGLTPTHFDRFLAKLDMPDLRRLDLSGRPVGAKAARRLTDPRFRSLTRLGLRDCNLSNAAASALLASPTLRNLIQLDLDDNELTGGADRLADPSVLPCLASCSLDGNPLAAPVARKLRRRPGVRL